MFTGLFNIVNKRKLLLRNIPVMIWRRMVLLVCIKTALLGPQGMALGGEMALVK